MMRRRVTFLCILMVLLPCVDSVANPRGVGQIDGFTANLEPCRGGITPARSVNPPGYLALHLGTVARGQPLAIAGCSFPQLLDVPPQRLVDESVYHGSIPWTFARQQGNAPRTIFIGVCNQGIVCHAQGLRKLIAYDLALRIC